MTNPLVSILEPDASMSDAIRRRFGADYVVDACADAETGLSRLEAASDVALVIAPLRMSQMNGIDYLVRARELHPDAKRILVIAVGDVAAQDDIRRALTLNQIDFFCGASWASPEEELYPVVGEALRLWALDHQPRYDKAQIIDREGGRGEALRTFLDRNGVSTSLHRVGTPAADALLDEHGLTSDRTPVLVLWDGRVLVDPAPDELAESLGAATRPRPGLYDLVVVGGGPAGLAAATYGASEGLRVVCIEAAAMGGQAGTTSRIRNYLGFRWGISGAEFAARASYQAEELGSDFIVVRSVTALRDDGEHRIVVLDSGDEIPTRAVVLAGGVAYRRLGVPEVDALVGAGVFYGASASEARSMGGLRVFVLGGGNSAGQIATHLASAGAEATLLLRGPALGPPMTDYLIKEVEATSGLTVRSNATVVGAVGSQRLEQVVLHDARTGEDEAVPADALFVFIGARPHTEWLDGTVALDPNGFVLTGQDVPADRWPLERQPAYLETSMPGVFAAGDIRLGSVKRVAAAVGEGSTATLLVRGYLEPPA